LFQNFEFSDYQKGIPICVLGCSWLSNRVNGN